jgi:hypothetical protein
VRRGQSPTVLHWGRCVAGLLALTVLAVRADAEAATPAAPSPVEVRARVEPKSVTIGTPFRYILHIEADKNTEVIVPQLTGSLGDFEVTDFGGQPPRQEGGRTVIERWYTLVTYTAGDAIVPGPTVQYRQPGSDIERVAAPDVLVGVQSLLAARDGKAPDDVREIKGPVAVPHDFRPLLWVGAAVLAVVGLAAGLFWLLNRRRRVAAPAPRPAHEIALEALARLRAGGLVEAGRPGEFYVRLSTIVRAYLEARFHLRAPEMTTEEFLQAAQRDPQLTPPQRSLLGQFLSEADLVKFARHVPYPEDAERAYAAAREFVESTAPPEVPRVAA